MEQDNLLFFPMSDQFPSLFDPSFLFTTSNTGGVFSPRDMLPGSSSPRSFPTSAQHIPPIQPLPTSAQFPDTVEYESTCSVGSRRSSDEFSESGCNLSKGWKKAAQDMSATMPRDVLVPSIPLPHTRATVPSSVVTINNGNKIFTCREPGCNKTYTTTEGLRLHNRNIHMKDKRHKCHVEGCDRAFVRASDLKLHILRIHEKERPFPCTEPDCNKSFACNSELTRHLNCHYRNRASRKKMRTTISHDF